MTTSRMGIMGSFLVSNFSLAVVKEHSKSGFRCRASGSSHLAVHLVYQGRLEPGTTRELAAKLLACFLHHGERNVAFFHHFPGYFELFDFLLTREVVHQIEHQLFENHAQPAGADLPHHGLTGDGAQGIVAEFETHILKFEQALILLHDGVLRAGEDLDESGFIQLFEHAHDRQPAYKFRNQPKFDQVLRLYFAEELETLLSSGS